MPVHFINEEPIEVVRGAAKQWRERNPDYQGGVVLVWQGQAYGWKNSLRDAFQERPGAFAVDEAGQVSKAEGGNDYDGAERWLELYV